MSSSRESSQPIHAIHKLDAYLGNMVANRRCELDLSPTDYLVLNCGCVKGHRATIRRAPAHGPGYADRKIGEIEAAFTCC